MTPLLVTKTPAEAQLAELLAPSIEGLGYQIVRLRLMGSGGRDAPLTLQIMAERPDGSMEIDDCAEVSHTISAILDVEDPIDREFSLEVSSPGIDRPLTRAEDFETQKGHRAKIETAMPVQTPTGPRRNFKGDLVGVDGDELVLMLDDAGETRLPLQDISDAKLVLTDELIAEALKKQRVPNAEGADDIEYDTEEGSDPEN